MPFALIRNLVLLIFVSSQLYWGWRAFSFARTRIQSKAARIWLAVIALPIYLVMVAFNFGYLGSRSTPTRMTLPEALLVAPFLWWAYSSSVAFLVVMVVWLVGRIAQAALWTVRKLLARPPDRASAARRQFLQRTATAAAAVPFVAGAYGLLYGRLNLETTEKRIRLARLPKAFEGFRIAQLSDIHIGPFMTESQIRNYVRITNALKPDLTVLTGDFITWDPSTQQAVVNALAGLKAPFGIFGCLGNHELWSNTEDSITLLLKQAGIRILRQARVPIAQGAEAFHLIGIDFPTRRRPFELHDLVVPGAVNILLSHHPNTFDQAAGVGIDLSLAGHTHGGQVTLEFVSPNIAPSRLVTPYVSGWFEKPGGQLYVNRGIGTVFAPMRIGAPPEIAVFELLSRA